MLPVFPTKKETCCLHTNLNRKHHSTGNMVCAREEGTLLVSQQELICLLTSHPAVIGPQMSHVKILDALWMGGFSLPPKF